MVGLSCQSFRWASRIWSTGFFPQWDEVCIVIMSKASLITRPWFAPYISVRCFSTGLIVLDSVFLSNLLIPALGIHCLYQAPPAHASGPDVGLTSLAEMSGAAEDRTLSQSCQQHSSAQDWGHSCELKWFLSLLVGVASSASYGFKNLVALGSWQSLCDEDIWQISVMTLSWVNIAYCWASCSIGLLLSCPSALQKME